MKILCIGDVIGSVGSAFMRQKLSEFKRQRGSIDAVIVNGENSADTNGITPDSAEYLYRGGADVITTGNHCFQRKESYYMYDEGLFCVIRPANYPAGAPGHGVHTIDFGYTQIAVVNLMGIVGMQEPLECPFRTLENLLKEIDAKIIIVDFHAEATAEKRALAEMFDGRVSAIFGTHTHVQTADEQILPKGTGFITDVGMTGPVRSVIGVKTESAIKKMTTHMPTRLEFADGPCMLNAVLFDIDRQTGLTTSVERIVIK